MNVVDAICMQCEKATINWLTGSPRLCKDCARLLRSAAHTQSVSLTSRRDSELGYELDRYVYEYAPNLLAVNSH